MSETLPHCSLVVEPAIAHRISADFRLRAHSIIRPWCVLDVRLIKEETLSEKESVSQPGNHKITNVESGR